MAATLDNATSQHLPLIKIAKTISKKEEKGDGIKRLVGDNQLKSALESPPNQALTGLGKLSGLYNTRPKPGDVYQNTKGSRLRPLGLLPDRKKTDVWKELSMLFSALPKTHNRGSHHIVTQTPDKVSPAIQNDKEDKVTTSQMISASVMPRPQVEYHGEYPRSPSYRHPKHNTSAMRNEDMTFIPFDDQEYLHTLALCDLKGYVSQVKEEDTNRAKEIKLPLLKNNLENTTSRGLQQPQWPQKEGQSVKMKHPYRPQVLSSNMEYFSFSGQAQLNKRLFLSDCRDAHDYEPCERCRLRGTRCSQCKVIRTGGGYIILDGLTSPSEIMRQERNKWKGWNQGNTSGLRSRGGTGRRRRRTGDNESGRNSSLGDKGRGEGEEDGRLSGIGWRGRGGKDGWDKQGSLDGTGSGRKSREGWTGLKQDSGTFGGYGDNSKGRVGSSLGDSSNSRVGQNTSIEDKDRQERQTGTGHSNREDNQEGKEEYDKGIESGGRGSRIGSSRPRSSLQRQGSAHPTKGGRIVSDRDKNRNTNLKKHETTERRRGDGDDDSDDENRKKRRIRYKSGDNGEQQNGEKESREYNVRLRKGVPEEDEENVHYMGDLMKFKSKRNEVKALKCTLKELQGIDPLDYLAKYCIIDQEKLPHYRRVFDNVDRDEDDEITIPELDFALKAVNYSLISDSELLYVNSILELAGRYALNFQLFSLVAALSEKVVALEDMVKRMINSMDFEALEVKMKKCKELFYLLADANDQEGVVTSSSLAVELQAGGLTQEHVEFVVDRLNHEGKGVIEFLGYLTYVPLFVEIHDNISDNPLDFSRTR